MFRNFLLTTFRSLARNKAFIFINTLGMGVAVACCITAYLNWDFSDRFDRNHVNGPSIYRVQARQLYQGQTNRHAIVPTALGGIVKDNFTDVDRVVRYNTAASDIRIGDDVFSTSVAYADQGFFELFTFNAVSGAFDGLRNKSQIIISDKLARKYFDEIDVTGKQITQINNGVLKEYTIVAVFEEQPLNSSFPFEAITLWDNYWDTTTDGLVVRDTDWAGMNTLFIRVLDVNRVDAITKRLQSYIEPQNRARQDLQLSEYYLQQFSTLAANFYGEGWLSGEQLRWGFPPSAVVGPAVMAIFLLLLACFNFTNTSIAISGKRLKEIGIRKTMGSMRGQLVAQFLGESVLMCVIAFIVGFILATFLVPAYNSLWPGIKLSLDVSGNVLFFVFLGGLLLLTAVLAGIYPAFYITAFRPIAILKGKVRFGGTNWFTRSLLTFQFAISLLCVICAVAYTRNARYQRNYDIGYAKSGVIVAPVNGKNEYGAYKALLESNKDIITIAGSRNHVADKYYTGPVKYGAMEKQVEIVDVGDNYLEAMEIRLIEGRSFSTDSETDKNESVIVTAEFVKQFGLKETIGERLLWRDSIQLYIVGVVKDILTAGYWKPAAPVMLRYTDEMNYTQLVVSTQPEDLLSVNEMMKQEWKKVSPNTVYAGQWIDGNLQATETINGNVVTIFGFLGVVAVLMSATGLFALSSLNILKRRKEIGVRKVLGASAGNIAAVINKEFMIILLVASLLGGGLGFVATDKMMDAIWEYYQEMDLVTLSICMGTLLAVAAITVSFKTIATAVMSPVSALKED
jgi:ABC-type antimicrobial peptide transport system permease subunit